MKSLRFKLCLIAGLAVLTGIARADEKSSSDSAPSTVVLPAFSASLSQLKIKLVIRYARTNKGSMVEAVYIGSVKSDSIAEKAGLRTDMELLAIQGQKVYGLNAFEFEAMCDQAVDDVLVLSVKRSPKASPEDIRIIIPSDSDKP